MDYYSYDDIASKFSEFMQELGVIPHEPLYFIADGHIHRFRTQEDDAGQTSGAYILHDDNIPAGYIQDWRKQVKEKWSLKVEGKGNKRKFDSKAFTEEALKRQQEREKKLQSQYNEKAELARAHFEQLPDSSIHSYDKNFHPYVKAKNILPWNARLNKDTNALTIPLYDIEGNIRSLQWIYADGKKKFFPGATTKAVFCNIYDSFIKDGDLILIGEGFATMSKVYELTHKPSIAAMSAGNLQPVAAAFREKYPNSTILIMADNDIATEQKAGYNPGLDAANDLIDLNIANAVVAPEFQPGVDDDCSDWDDYALKYGDWTAKKKLDHFVDWWALSQDERDKIEAERNAKKELAPLFQRLNFSTEVPQQEFVGGIFPKKFVSLVIAPPGSGKTMFMEKFVCDLSLGGSIFDGVAENEPQRKVLIFAGEAGFDMLIRRGNSFKWQNKFENITVIDQHQSEILGKTVMLDEDNDWERVKMIINIEKPDIVFWDTFSSFHDKDENKAAEIKPLIRKIASLAAEKNFAAVLNHHTRKRLAKERNLTLNQDDVIGSSVFNRLAALIIGMEKDEDEIDNPGKVLKVRPLKTWFKFFNPFNFTIGEDFWGHPTMTTDLEPKDVNNSRNGVWNYLVETFKPGEWFGRGDIETSLIKPEPSTWQLKRSLASLVKEGKIAKRGTTYGTEYSIVS